MKLRKERGQITDPYPTSKRRLWRRKMMMRRLKMI